MGTISFRIVVVLFCLGLTGCSSVSKVRNAHELQHQLEAIRLGVKEERKTVGWLAAVALNSKSGVIKEDLSIYFQKAYPEKPEAIDLQVQDETERDVLIQKNIDARRNLDQCIKNGIKNAKAVARDIETGYKWEVIGKLVVRGVFALSVIALLIKLVLSHTLFSVFKKKE